MHDYRCSCPTGYTGKNCSVGKELDLIKIFCTSTVSSKRKEGGGHWGILETAKPKKKIIQNRKKIRPKPKTAYKTVKKRYNGDKWDIQSKLNYNRKSSEMPRVLLNFCIQTRYVTTCKIATFEQPIAFSMYDL